MASKRHTVLLSNTSPAFLHANSTSHTWIFSAFAELIDNAYDPDANATVLKIDVIEIKGETCLTFMDNGKGMTPEKLHKMLSFGFCEKIEVDGHKPVGQYGNGFKSGSMRLGRDAIVITKCSQNISVGFLSQTYLQKIKANTVLVPIITMNKKTKVLESRAESADSLEDIYKFSILSNDMLIMEEISKLDHVETGTRIIIYDLKKGNNNMYELDFISNPKDIINSEHCEFDVNSVSRMAKEYVPEYRRSLREYCSILFLKPKMKIILRSEKVKTKLISRSLRQSEIDIYKPKFLQKQVKIIFGFVDSKEDCGMMLYHRNRLIKAYERVGPQKQSNCQALGIVGVIEVDFLDPIHNKQDFNKTDRYNACMYALGVKLNDYWLEKTLATEIDVDRISDNWTWVQCDNLNCLKWRRLPEGSSQDLPDKWFCYMNRDPTHNRCDIAEEPEDEDAFLKKKPSCTYEKTVKKKKNSLGLNKQLNAQQWEEEVRLREEQLVKVKEETEKQTEEAQLQVKKLADELEDIRKKYIEQCQLVHLLSNSKSITAVPSTPVSSSLLSSTVNNSALTINDNSSVNSLIHSSSSCAVTSNGWSISDDYASFAKKNKNNRGVGKTNGVCVSKKKSGVIDSDTTEDGNADAVVNETDADTDCDRADERTNILSNNTHKEKKTVKTSKSSKNKRKRRRNTSEIIVIGSDDESSEEVYAVQIKEEIEKDNESEMEQVSCSEDQSAEKNMFIQSPKRTKLKVKLKKKKVPTATLR